MCKLKNFKYATLFFLWECYKAAKKIFVQILVQKYHVVGIKSVVVYVVVATKRRVFMGW